MTDSNAFDFTKFVPGFDFLKNLTPQALADFLMSLNREVLLQRATKAYGLRQIAAAQDVAQACAEVLA